MRKVITQAPVSIEERTPGSFRQCKVQTVVQGTAKAERANSATFLFLLPSCLVY